MDLLIQPLNFRTRAFQHRHIGLCWCSMVQSISRCTPNPSLETWATTEDPVLFLSCHAPIIWLRFKDSVHPKPMCRRQPEMIPPRRMAGTGQKKWDTNKAENRNNGSTREHHRYNMQQGRHLSVILGTCN